MSEQKEHKYNLNQDEKKALLTIARCALERAVIGTQKEIPHYDMPVLDEKRGVFVTIHNRGELRGCIGYVVGKRPLKETVEEMAQAAALRDSRFKPVTASELSEIDLEISVLSPLREIKDVNEIEVGTHGLMIRAGMYSGLLLPQVAVEHNWDRETFLEYTCMKAGLYKDAWKDENVSLSVFSAQVFSEKDMF